MHRTARCTASLFAAVALAAVPSSADPYPAYVTAGAPVSEYTLFANTGWHANWYVGYNTCWIKRFPREALPDLAAFRAAAIGVKLGRAKQKPAPTGRETVREGAVYVGIASTAAWKANQRHLLCSVADIPSEGSPDSAVTTTGEARWFFTEIPIDTLADDGDLWVCVYADQRYLSNAAASPIMAGAPRDPSSPGNTWLNTDITGSPPINPAEALKVPVGAYDPAIIIRLIPREQPRPAGIALAAITDGRSGTDEKVFYVRALTPGIERMWMELSQDRITWQRISRFAYGEPYAFAISLATVPPDINGDFHLRFAAQDIFMQTAYTPFVTLTITRGTEPAAR